MAKVLITMPDAMLAALDRLVKEGFYASRSEAIRDALRLLFHNQSEEEDEHDGDVMDFLSTIESPRDFSYS